jgi:hypothetical protein
MTKQFRQTTSKPTDVTRSTVARRPEITRQTHPVACAIGHSCFVIRHFLIAVVGALMLATAVEAQSKAHFLNAGRMPPGAIGAQQLARGGPLPGYFQPVEIKAPQGALVSFAVEGQFSAPQSTPLKVGMLIAPVYRLRVMQIPEHEGAEVYPTVEIINRIYPPVGEEFRFPIPIELTRADLELALAGKFVTRVIYLEDPQSALPIAQGPEKEQSYFEIRPIDDPLEVADRLGRPVAIVRIGGRVPDSMGPDEKFMFGSPMLLVPNSLDLFSEPIVPPVEMIDPAPRMPVPPLSKNATKPAVRRNDNENKHTPANGSGELTAKSEANELRGDETPTATTSSTERSSRRTISRPSDAPTKSTSQSARSPVVKAVGVQKATQSAWQPDKPAPAGVSISDEE